MKISTVFFDLGKVLVDFDFNIAAYHIARRSPMDAEELSQKAYESYREIDLYETGAISSREFFTRLKHRFKFEGTHGELRRIWCDIFTPMDEHIRLARRVAEYYPVAVISNTSAAHIEHLEASYDFFPIFRKRFYSHEVKIMKPDPGIYLHALQEMKADKYESLFIDDREDNILAASRMGWQTIHLRPDVSLQLALESYELKGF